MFSHLVTRRWKSCSWLGGHFSKLWAAPSLWEPKRTELNPSSKFRVDSTGFSWWFSAHMASWCSALPPRAVCWSTDCFCGAVASVILLESSCLASWLRMAMSWTKSGKSQRKSHLAEDFGLNVFDVSFFGSAVRRFGFGSALPGHWKSSPSRKPSVWASCTASENPWKIDGQVYIWI